MWLLQFKLIKIKVFVSQFQWPPFRCHQPHVDGADLEHFRHGGKFHWTVLAKATQQQGGLRFRFKLGSAKCQSPFILCLSDKGPG